VEVRPVDVNFSGYDCRLEGDASARPAGANDGPETWGVHGPAIRLGMRLVRGLSVEQAVGIEQARGKGRFGSVGELARRSGIGRAGLAKLAAADAFGSMGLDRRQAMWQVLRQGEALPLLAGLDEEEPVVPLPDEPCEQAVAYDYHHVGLSLKVHPMALRREELARRGVVEACRLAEIRSGGRVAVAGLVTVRQRPSTAKGIVFMTLEDETGVANLLVRPDLYERFRKVARSAKGMLAAGKLERSDGVVHVVVDRMVDLADDLGPLPAGSRDFR
jgi:error-prone DNA polymerase